MGYMTEIGILNDRWDEIRKDPAKFVEQIYQSSMSYGRTPNWIIGQTTVAKTHHADDLKVYYAAGNSFFDAYPEREWDARRLQMHMRFLKEMRSYLETCAKETHRLGTKLDTVTIHTGGQMPTLQGDSQ